MYKRGPELKKGNAEEYDWSSETLSPSTCLQGVGRKHFACRPPGRTRDGWKWQQHRQLHAQHTRVLLPCTSAKCRAHTVGRKGDSAGSGMRGHYARSWEPVY